MILALPSEDSFVYAQCNGLLSRREREEEEYDKQCGIDARELFRRSVFRTREPLERERSVDETSIRETVHDHVCAEAADRFRGTFLRK